MVPRVSIIRRMRSQQALIQQAIQQAWRDGGEIRRGVNISVYDRV